MRKRYLLFCLSFFSSTAFAVTNIVANEGKAVDLTNTPFSGNIQIPIELNYNTHINEQRSGHETDLIAKPVVPFHLAPDWDLVSRSEIPLALTHNLDPNQGRRFGLGDIEETLYMSPHYEGRTFNWGIGPKFRLVTATPKVLGQKKWGVGPAAFVVYQTHQWAIGGLISQLWGFAGAGNEPSSILYMEPHIAYTTDKLVTYNLSTQATYYWPKNKVEIPINFVVIKRYKLQCMEFSIGAGLRYWAVTVPKGAKDFGGRIIVNFIFPNKYF